MKPELKKIYDANLKDFGHLNDDEIMALTIWAESRGEPLPGKVAVGTVILNRVRLRQWDGNTIMEVCLWPKQFSCSNPDDKQRTVLVDFAEDREFSFEHSASLKDCYVLAQGLINGVIRKDEDIWQSKCCQYLTTAAKQHCNWWKSMRFVKKIGNHEFYTDL